MKTMWDKLRKWIIKKLGGSVEPLKRPEIASARINLVDVYSSVELPYYQMRDVGDIGDNAYVLRRMLAEQIARRLLEDDLLDIAKADNPRNMTVIYKARIKVCDMRGFRDAGN